MSQLGTITRVDFDQEVAHQRDDLADDYSGWYCVRTDSWPCPADGCDFVAFHMTAAHMIVVWPSRDDIDLLSYANDAAQIGRNPRIEEYRPELGACIPYDQWVGMGKPVHALYDRPIGVGPFRRL